MDILKTGSPVVTTEEDFAKAMSVAEKFFGNGQAELAYQWYRAALDYRRDAFALSRLAHIGRFQGRFTAAKGFLRQALDLQPGNPELMVNLASLEVLTGEQARGIDRAREAVTGPRVSCEVISSYLITLHYASVLDPECLFAEHVRLGAQFANPAPPARPLFNDPDPDRLLRIGYLGADFRMHSVAYNMEAFFSAYDRSDFEVVGYHTSPLSDHFTQHLAARCAQFRQVTTLSDSELSDQIQADGIDILVFVGGHTMDNRLGVAAHRPAPIQVDYGSINTIGLPQIDYRLTDTLLDPPGSESRYLERLSYLEDGLVCYRPPSDAPAVGPLPMLQNGHVTFGSFNGSQKTSREVIGLWAEVLAAVPGSRFLLKFAGGDDPAVAECYRRWFADSDIDPKRLEILGWLSPGDHLSCYERVDIALDTFPYHGCLTTLEGLWMGVPLISLRGDCYVSRVSETILSRLDMAFFVAHERADYVCRARALASNVEALTQIRATLRQRLQGSVLTDARRFAGQVEQAYRAMWRAWACATSVEMPTDGAQMAVETR